MKIKDLIIITIALFTISIAILNVINKNYTQAIYYAVLGFPVLVYTIYAMKHETRLENALQDFRDKHKSNLATNTKLNRDLEELQIDFDNQVRATDLAEKEIKRLKEKQNEIPFAENNDNTEELYTCPECGEVMNRHTSKIWFCDNPSCHRKQWRIDKLTK